MAATGIASVPLRRSRQICFDVGAIFIAGAMMIGCPAASRRAQPEFESSPVRENPALPPQPLLDEDEIVAWTTQTFDKVIYYKPAASTADSLEQTLAPLIVEEFVPGRRDQPLPIGRIVNKEDADGPPVHQRSADSSTIYTASSIARIAQSDFRQVLYAWWYPTIERHTFDWAGQFAAVRITIGSDGFPLVYEVFGGPRRRLFVAKSLDDAAAAQFGPPLPGRRFSIERGRDETPGVMVAGVLEDGPVPMGPYVYIRMNSDPIITTVLCRCSPSQFNEVEKTIEYDLRPLNEFGRFGAPPRGDDSLDQVLRWPAMGN